MELNFGENIRRLRRARELTQEQLANALGVTAQSVSKWECAYGYPDITQLPAIANFFGVSIDELLSNDSASREAERERFQQECNGLAWGSEEKIDFIREYYRRYPDDLFYAYCLSCELSNHIVNKPAHRAKYMPLLREAAEKMLDSAEYRISAVQHMVLACEDSEVEAWLKLAPYNANYTRRSMMIERCIRYGEEKNWLIYQGLESIENMAKQLEQRYPDTLGPVRKAEYHMRVLAVLDSFGKDGRVPDGWLAFYAYKQLVLAACFIGSGDPEGGKAEFLSAMEKLRRFHGLTDEYLDMGGILFGNLRVNRMWTSAMDEDGNLHRLYGTAPCRSYAETGWIRDLLVNPRWAWFNRVRGEAWFVEALEWLESLPEQEKD